MAQRGNVSEPSRHLHVAASHRDVQGRPVDLVLLVDRRTVPGAITPSVTMSYEMSYTISYEMRC